MRAFLGAVLALLPGLALAQTPAAPSGTLLNPNRIMIGITPGTVAGGDALAAEIARAMAAEASNATHSKTAQGQESLRLDQSQPLYNDGNPGIAATYYGANAAATDDVQAYLPNGHYRLNVACRGWNGTTDGIAVVVNGNPQQMGGNQGYGWDFGQRTAYAGQDCAGLNTLVQGITPLATGVRATFSTVAVTNLAGAPDSVMAVHLGTPLTPAQSAAVQTRMRVETNNRFYGYVIPRGLLTLTGTLPLVSPDGSTIYVDRFARGAPYDQEPAGSTPTNYGMLAPCPAVAGGTCDAPLSSVTVTIDTAHLIENLGGALIVEDGKGIEQGYALEHTIINRQAAEPTVNIDVKQQAPLLATALLGCTTDQPVTPGVCVSGPIVDGRFRYGFVANNHDAGALQTTGFYNNVNGAFFGFRSSRPDGYAFWVDPGGGPHTAHITAGGEGYFAANVGVGGDLNVNGTINGVHLAPPTSSTLTCSGPLTLTYPPTGDVSYDITLTGPCELSVAGGTAGVLQTMEITAHEGAVDGWPLTMPAGVKWPYSQVPTPNTAAGISDEYFLRTKDGGATLIGSY